MVTEPPAADSVPQTDGAAARQPAVDVAALLSSHQQRWRALDPLLAPPGIDDAGPAPHTVSTASGDGIGCFLDTEVTDADVESLWGALRTHRLRVYLDGAEPSVPFAALLDQFEDHLTQVARPGDSEAAAVVTLPSRACELAHPLTMRGYAPLVVLAARSRPDEAGPPAAVTLGAGPSRTTVRPAEFEDLGVMVELAVELNRYDANFGAVTTRSTAPGLLRDSIEQQLQVAPGWTWVAEDDDRIVGLAQVQPPDQAAWVAPAVAAASVAYLSMLYVRPEARGGNIGVALAARAHQALDEANVEVTLLHHALPNPRSTPFWARQCYGPLWTAWQRRPAMRP